MEDTTNLKSLNISDSDITLDYETKQGEEIIEISKKQLIILMIGLFFTISVAALDTTIITTVIGTIASDLNGFNNIAWVATAYFLTSNSFQLLYGKFSDIFGRKYTTLFALLIFLVGSILCGISSNIIMLIISRAIAGIGGGGLMTLCTIIISDIVPLKDRGYYIGITTVAFTISSGLGTVLGGIFVIKLSWRWCFYINIPICIIAILILFFCIKPSNNGQNWKQKLKRVDYLGCFTLLSFTILLCLALNWGGQQYSWSSPAVLVTLFLSILFLISFIYSQYKVSLEPIIPSTILVRNVISCSITIFCNGVIFFSYMIYIPLYFQIQYEESALQSTLSSLPLTGVMILFSISSSFFISKTGIYIPLNIVGTFISLSGTILMSVFMDVHISRYLVYLFCSMIGAGIGLCMQTSIIACQAAVNKSEIALVTAFIEFIYSFGGIIGISILGTVYQNVAYSYISNYSKHIDLSQLNDGIAFIFSLDDNIKFNVIQGYVFGFRAIFFSGIGFLIIGFISSLFLRHISLKKK